MTLPSRTRILASVPLLALGFSLFIPPLAAQLLWTSTAKYQYNVDSLDYIPDTRILTVVFSVTNPLNNHAPYNVLSNAAPYTGGATLRVVVGWTNNSYGSPEFLNTADTTLKQRTWMTTAPPTDRGGVAPAVPITIDALKGENPARPCGAPSSPAPCPTGSFWMITTLPNQVSGTGRLFIEGHPSEQTGVDPIKNAPIYSSVPVKTIYRDFPIASSTPRRQVVDINKCKQCHDDRQHGDTIVPRLSLHGANRNEELGACVVCHNPNQTDVAYRASGAEQSVDFKRMIHGIHAGGFRKTPLSIVAFQGNVVDFSHVRFPSKLRDCTKCHTDNGSKGTFELPLATKLGSSINTGSTINNTTSSYVDRDPSNDLRISPIAATCSGCHDSSEVKSHMISKGASFAAVQSNLQDREQCNTCHGRGRSEDVRRAHEISSSTSRSSEREDH